MEYFKILSLLISLSVPIHAKSPLIESKVNSGYKIEKRTVFGTFSDDLKSGTPDVFTYQLIGPDGNKILDLENVNFDQYMPHEVCGDEVMWQTFVPNKAGSREGTFQYWTYNLKTKVKEKLPDVGDIHYPSPDCRKFISTNLDYNLSIYDRDKKTSTVITKLGDGGRTDGFTPIEWSQDGSKFWFGSGVAETFSRLGYYQAGKVIWSPVENPSDDYALEPNKGWLAHSNYPQFVDAEDAENYRNSDNINYLKISEVMTGKEILIKEAKVNKFSPSWNSDAQLFFKVKGKEKSISRQDIEKKFKSTKVPSQNN